LHGAGRSGSRTIATFRPDDPDGPTADAAAAGDAAAFARLVESLHARVFRFILRQIPNPSDAEDLTQDTFLEVYRKLETFRGASKVSTWVMGIALNIARNHRNRAPQHKYRWTSDAVLESLPARETDPHRRAETGAFARAVQEGLDALPDDLREAVTLISLDGLSYDEAAAVTGVPVGTMKTRVFRARRQLRERLESDGKDHLLGP
jgi:RNA polymerase sigma-70 factor (ECF subfamily)